MGATGSGIRGVRECEPSRGRRGGRSSKAVVGSSFRGFEGASFRGFVSDIQRARSLIPRCRQGAIPIPILMGSQSTTRPRALGLPKGIACHFHVRKGSGGVDGGYSYVCYGGATHAVANFGFALSFPRSAMRGRTHNSKMNLPMSLSRWKCNLSRLICVKGKAQVCIRGLSPRKSNLMGNLLNG